MVSTSVPPPVTGTVPVPLPGGTIPVAGTNPVAGTVPAAGSMAPIAGTVHVATTVPAAATTVPAAGKRRRVKSSVETRAKRSREENKAEEMVEFD